MVKFITGCIAVVVLSFFAVPVFTGISNERGALLDNAQTASVENDSLSFEEIYEIAAENTNPADLNNIAPAAGGNIQTDSFSSGFSKQEDSALENNAPIIVDVNEPTNFE